MPFYGCSGVNKYLGFDFLVILGLGFSLGFQVGYRVRLNLKVLLIYIIQAQQAMRLSVEVW